MQGRERESHRRAVAMDAALGEDPATGINRRKMEGERRLDGCPQNDQLSERIGA